MTDQLKHTEGRIIVSCDLQGKNSHTFQDGTKIKLERGYNNFNRRESQPVNAIVISAKDIPEGSEILIHHNAVHDVNRIFNYKQLSGKDEGADVKYYSIRESECFAWRDEKGTIQPMKNFAFGLRVFQPYLGILEGIEPSIIKDVLYITTGELANKICHVLRSSDYEIIYQDTDGREASVIRCRHFEDSYDEQEEVTAISHHLTDKLNNGQLLIGLTKSDAKPFEIKEYAN